MKVLELIKELQKVDQNKEIFVAIKVGDCSHMDEISHLSDNGPMIQITCDSIMEE